MMDCLTGNVPKSIYSKVSQSTVGKKKSKGLGKVKNFRTEADETKKKAKKKPKSVVLMYEGGV